MNTARNVLSNESYGDIVGLYVRVSSNEQAQEGYSIGEQESRLRTYCEAMRWTIHKVYIDPGFSGGNTDRPALKELIKDVEAGKVNKVVVYKLDRLSRSQFDTLYLIEKVFLANNTDFVSMTENFSTSSSLGKAMIGFLAVFAQLEKDKINERTIMGKEARAKEGKWSGGSAEPAGYDYNVATGELEVNEYEKMQILEAVDLFFKGTPLRTICNMFSQKGYTCRGVHGKPSEWDPKKLKYAFANKLYIGYIRHHDEWYKGTHQPIMDDETFDRLQVMLQNRKKMYEKHTKRCTSYTTYLGGMLRCKHCGGKYAMSSWGKRTATSNTYYSCYSRSKKMPKMIKDPNCMNKNWRMEDLDAIVLGEIKKLALEPEYYNTIRNENRATVEPVDKISLIKGEIEKLSQQISRFMDLYGLGHIPIDQVSDKITPLNKQKAALEAELESIINEEPVMSQEEVVDIAGSLEEVLNGGDLNEVRLLIESLIEYIELDNDDVYIHWKFA